MQRRRALLVAANLLLLPAVTTALTCYNVDGSKPVDDSFQPCFPDADVSSCCANSKGARSDVCLSSGLCLAQDQEFKGFVYSNGCTDQSGKSDNCPHFCPDATNNWGGGSPVSSWNILQCNPGTYCCRPGLTTTNCCNNQSALITNVDIGTVVFATATSGSSTATGATVTTTVTAPAQGSCTAGVDASCKDNSGVVGGAVGGVLGAALLAALGTIAFMCTRRRKDSTPPAAAPAEAGAYSPYAPAMSYAQSPGQSISPGVYAGAPKYDVPNGTSQSSSVMPSSASPPQELGAGREIHELYQPPRE